MPESAFTRFWNSVKPPPAESWPPRSPEERDLRRRQRKLILITLSLVLAMASGTAMYNYISSAPQRAEKEYLEGMKLMSPGKYPDAISHFNRALEIKPQYPEVYLERANAHRMQGEMDLALADYQAAVNLNPSAAPAHNGIAMIYLERHDPAHAIEELTRSISLQPTTDAYYQRGQIYESQGEHQKAIDDYDRAIAEQRDAPFVYLARATARHNLGDEEGAAADRATAQQILNH
ncbi:MAG TPA: tetratricopeptide repeat protein [Bryobacteraceae bacterium]|nr:tetratricopeptide repeat protein [Bryobacteraceae bacterium]